MLQLAPTFSDPTYPLYLYSKSIVNEKPKLPFSLSPLHSIPVFLSPTVLVSVYKSILALLRSTAKSWENLHLSPFWHWPLLKNWHNTVFGSTPNGTFWVCTGLKSSASSSFFFCSAAFFWAMASFLASASFCYGVGEGIWDNFQVSGRDSWSLPTNY